MLQVIEGCAHILDPNSVYIEGIHQYRGLNQLQLIFALKLNPFIGAGG